MPITSEKEKIVQALCLQHVNNLISLDSSEYNFIFALLHLTYLLQQLGTDDSDDSEEDVFVLFNASIAATIMNRRGVHLRVPKSTEWRGRVLDDLDARRFSQMLRVNPVEFEHIFNLIKTDPIFDGGPCGVQLPIKLQLQITLYRLGCSGEGATIRKIASVFGVGDGGTLQIVTNRVLKAIINLKERFIFWPNAAEKKRILARAQYELPGCIGYIDGTELRLAEAPSRNHAYYFSRKRQYSIKMQVICDDKLIIRQASYGHAGSIHDARIFANCAIARFPNRFCARNEWIAADSAYALRPYILTPFRKNSNEFTTEQREKYNEYFAKYRVRVENCFGKLKEKFGSLKELKFRLHNENNKKLCNNWIFACCILHNIIIYFNSSSDSNSPNNLNQLSSVPYENKRDWLVNWINSRHE